MPKQQSSLDSFFSGGTKKKNSQTRVDSFFKKNGASTEKENNKRSSEAIEGKPKASGSGNGAANKPFKANKLSSEAKKKRRVIDDDSDSDDEKDNQADKPVLKKEDTSAKKENDDDAGDSKEKVDEKKDENVAGADDAVDKDEDMPDAAPQEEDKDGQSKMESKAAKPIESSKAKSTKPLTEIVKPTAKSQKNSSSEDTTPPSASTPYGELCDAFESIEGITSRLEIQAIVTKLFRKQIDSGNPENLLPLLYLCSSTVAPAYDCIELGVGDSLLMKAIAEAYGSSLKVVKAKYETDGDLGLVAQTFKGKQRTLGGFFATTKKTAKKEWSCQEILNTFRDIANMKGGQSQKLKVDKIKKMLVGATHAFEPKYIMRALQGKLRIGLARSTVLISLAHALALSVPPKAELADDEEGKAPEDYPVEARNYVDKKQPKEKRLEAAVAIIKKASSEVPSYDALLDAALSVPLQKMHIECSLTPGIPVEPMLAKPTKSILEVLKRLNGQRFTAEYKYDGERAQVHMMPDGSTKVFSRNLLNTSEKFPEVPLFVKEAASDTVKSCVLDTEVVAYDTKKGKLVPFQVLSTRKKTEESAETAKVQVIAQAFDLMYLNGQSLLSLSFQERRDLLHKHFSVVEGKFAFAVALDYEENGETTQLEEFLDQAVKGQCEGLMVKTLDVNAIYEPSRRSLNWLKLKKDYLEGLGDSLDLVPIGGYFGKGKRTGVYGAYLLACYDPETEEFQSVCKVGTGFSDEALKSLAESLNKHTIPQKTSQYNVTDQLECDVWFDSVQVWEIKAADLSTSSAHRGAVGKTGEEGRGIGLRFPRFERIREDKRPEEATSADQVLEMYYNQDSVGGGGATKGGDEDDDDDGI